MLEKSLLSCEKAVLLYEKVKDLPIIDYHNHLSIDDIKNNIRFLNIYDLWIKPDPYKHRAMRMYGVDEEYITGNKSCEEKFCKWCEIFPYLIGNPLYLWSLYELNLIFGISCIPDKENACMLYKKMNNFLNDNEVTPDYFMRKFNVEVSCPCINIVTPTDDFKNYTNIKPSLRGDDMLKPDEKFVEAVGLKSGISVKSLSDYKKAISILLDRVTETGCKFADHSVDSGFVFFDDDGKNEERFLKLAGNLQADDEDIKKLFSYLLVFLCEEYSKRGLVLQLHIGAKRETSEILREKAGSQGGFAAIGNTTDISSLTELFSSLEKTEYGIPKTILFTLNPSDNAKFSVLSGSFARGGVSGLITQGPAWWWCDHKKGIGDMLDTNAAYGAICNFVGMTTDSRSFLSFVRHDYFRRILCDWYAKKCMSGEFLNSDEMNEKILYNLCYGNAKSFFEEE